MKVPEMFLMGAKLSIWFKLLKENNFDISLKNIPKCFLITFVIVLSIPFTIFEKVFSYRRIQKKELTKPPIFIIGHWRSGTTFLHELLNQDPRFEYMSITESVFPNLFLYFSKLIKFFLAIFLPPTRPQDDMKMHNDFPSEHDFAIVNMSSMSPYAGACFPKKQKFYNKFVTFEGTTPRQRKQMKKSIFYLIKKVSIKKKDKQLVFKSPVDTARIDFLVDLFPDAKFIHIIRNPYEVYFSTLRMYKKLIPIYQLQNSHPDLDEFVISTYKTMYEKYYNDVHLIPEGNLIEVKYENLISDPVNELSQIYKKLSLPNFNFTRTYIKTYLESVRDFTTSSYNIKIEEQQRIYSEWHKYIDTMGYEKPI